MAVARRCVTCHVIVVNFGVDMYTVSVTAVKQFYRLTLLMPQKEIWYVHF